MAGASPAIFIFFGETSKELILITNAKLRSGGPSTYLEGLALGLDSILKV